MALILLKENILMLSPYCCLLQEVHIACYVKLSGATVFLLGCLKSYALRS